MRVRLSFLADSWEIDWVGVAFEGSGRVRATTLPLTGLYAAGGAPVSPEALNSKDEQYFNLYPGEAVEAAFGVNPVPPELTRTYFVETRGYFIKWLGPEHFVGSRGSLRPDAEDLFRAARRWLDQKEALQTAFRAAGTAHP
jgi:hypothetical protein